MKRVLACLLAAVSINASAVLLAPGSGPTAPGNFTGQLALVPLASNPNQSFASLTPAFTGIATTAVFVDLATHDLDFLYQVTNNSTSADAILRLTASNFSGFTTDVGFRTDGASILGGLFTNGTAGATPATVDRLSGDTIGFNSTLGGTGLIPGATSNVLEIKTDATTFRPGNLAEINASIAEVGAFAPARVPEPGTLALAGLGALALALFAP